MNEGEHHAVDRTEAETTRVAAFVRGRDAACPNCGYNLRDLSNRRCPECGKLLKLVRMLKPTYRDDRLWSFAVLAASMMALVWIMAYGPVSSGRGGAPFTVIVWLVVVACSVVLAVGLTMRRKPFLAMPPQRQRLAVLMVWGGHAMAGVLLLVIWMVVELLHS